MPESEQEFERFSFSGSGGFYEARDEARRRHRESDVLLIAGRESPLSRAFDAGWAAALEWARDQVPSEPGDWHRGFQSGIEHAEENARLAEWRAQR